MQVFYPTNRVPGICEDDLYADLDMDEVDINFENYEELFGVTLTHSEQLLENGGINSLFSRQDMRKADSNRPGGLCAEVRFSTKILVFHVLWLGFDYI